MGHDPTTGLTIVIGTNLATAPNGAGSALVILKSLIPTFYPNAVIPGDPAAAPAPPRVRPKHQHQPPPATAG